MDQPLYVVVVNDSNVLITDDPMTANATCSRLCREWATLLKSPVTGRVEKWVVNESPPLMQPEVVSSYPFDGV